MDEGHQLEAWSGTPMNIRELLGNFLRAVERFRLQDTNAAKVSEQLVTESLGHAALMEALNWADSIDQYLRFGPRDTLGTDRDQDWASGLPEAQSELILAFQRVRNLVHHAWWQAITVRMHLGQDGQVNEWVWGFLPHEADRMIGKGSGSAATKKDQLGDEAYGSALRGRPLLGTLDGLAEIFWAKRTWEITRDDVRQPGHDVLSPLTFDGESGLVAK
jgi:hypothetical protein